MISWLRNTLLHFIKSDKAAPLTAGLGAGLYPVLFYYNNNYAMANSWQHLLFFFGVFIALPTLGLLLLRKIFSYGQLKPHKKYLLPFFSVFVFLFLLMYCIYAEIHESKVIGIFILADLFALLAWRHYKKLIVVQLLLAAVVFVKLLPDFYRHLRYDDNWAQLTPEEKSIKFVKKPNIYFIQPDGYVNAAELRKGYYKYDNSAFESWLGEQGFRVYETFRGNYYSTLSANSSLFMMKHHYYQNKISERKDIVGENNVLTLLKANGYQTFLLIETEYLIFNRTPLYYDHCNISPLEMDFIGTGIALRKNLIEDLHQTEALRNAPYFYFIEHIKPTHITTSAATSLGVEGERLAYLERLEDANAWLKAVIGEITEKDPEGLIVIMADHGGYVGMGSTAENFIKTQDRDKIYSVFGTQLAVKWPETYDASLDAELGSAVNFFRVLFSWLSDSRVLLEHKEKDRSYIQLEEGAPPGVYEYIAEDGAIQAKKIE